MRSGSMPSCIMTCAALFARCAPSARLYSVEPRSSQWPSMTMLVSGCFFIYSAWDSSVSRASSEILAESKEKKTWFPSIDDGTCVHAEMDAAIKIKKYFFIS